MKIRWPIGGSKCLPREEFRNGEKEWSRIHFKTLGQNRMSCSWAFDGGRCCRGIDTDAVIRNTYTKTPALQRVFLYIETQIFRYPFNTFKV